MAKQKKDEMNLSELAIKYMPVDDLVAAEYNPRTMTEEDKRHIIDSIKRFGFVDPVIVNVNPDRMNIIVGGHQRVTVAKELGFETVPCVFVNLTLDRERELNVRLNKNTGRWDKEKLQQHFSKEWLQEVGFKEDELDFSVSEFEKKFNSINNSNCEMPLVPKFSEKYDAVIIVSTNSIDTTFLDTTLNIRTAQSYKNKRTGKAMIISVDQFKQAIHGE